jgi:hypothetical protein
MAPESAPKLNAGGIGRAGISASLMRVVRRALGKTESSTRKGDDDKTKLVQKESSGPGRSQVPADVESSIDEMVTKEYNSKK